MAAVILPSSRSTALSSLRIFAKSLPHAAFSWLPFVSHLPTLKPLLELLPPFLLAVPKKKTSHSRKAMRAANKGLKDKTNIVNCPGCGAAKLAHHLCPECYSSANRAWKARQKDAGVAVTDQPVQG